MSPWLSHGKCRLVSWPLHNPSCPQVSQAPLLVESQPACRLVPRTLHQPVCCQLCWPSSMLKYEPRCQLVQESGHRPECRQESPLPTVLMCRPACQPVPRPSRRLMCPQFSFDQCHDINISECFAKCVGIISDRGSARVSISALTYTLFSVSLIVSAPASVSVSDTISISALAYTLSIFLPKCLGLRL